MHVSLYTLLIILVHDIGFIDINPFFDRLIDPLAMQNGVVFGDAGFRTSTERCPHYSDSDAVPLPVLRATA